MTTSIVDGRGFVKPLPQVLTAVTALLKVTDYFIDTVVVARTLCFKKRHFLSQLVPALPLLLI